MEAKELLQKRRLLKKKKPEFIRQDAHKKKKLCWKWRKPKGSDSKMRVSRKGYKRSVRAGWGSPAVVSGLDRSGLEIVRVMRTADLQGVDPQKDIIVIGSGVGTKKAMEIVEQAISKNIQIQNYKDPQKFLNEIKEKFEKKKQEKKKLKEEREKKKEAAKKEAEKKKAKEEAEKKKEEEKKGKGAGEKEDEQTDEEKKLEQKKEQDKVLISTQ
jgi:large subunit ribosomal protein L32e